MVNHEERERGIGIDREREREGEREREIEMERVLQDKFNNTTWHSSFPFPPFFFYVHPQNAMGGYTMSENFELG